MSGRERVMVAAGGGQPDRIPFDFWAVAPVFERLAAALDIADRESVLRRFGVDLRYFRGPGLPEVEPDAQGVVTDHWGVRRQRQEVNGRRGDGTSYSWEYQHLVDSPLATAETVADVEAHAWPDPANWDYSEVKGAARAIRDAGCAVVFGGDRLDRTAQLKAGMYLRGPEQFVMDLALNPAIAEAILEHVAAYYLDYNRRVFLAAEGAIDIFFMGDDMGTQDSTWVSIDMYRTFFKTRFAAFNELAHRFGMRTMFHSCGRVSGLIGEFLDAGLDILQSLQPGAMAGDFPTIKRDYGRDLCFQGGIDIQHVLPHGSPDDVRCHVAETARVLGPDGYIFGTAHNILPDTPTDNILALVDAYHEFGQA